MTLLPVLVYPRLLPSCSFFFFNDTATTEIYTLSLHDALPISSRRRERRRPRAGPGCDRARARRARGTWTRAPRSEEHTSELQSRPHLVCRLLLEKKKNSVSPTVDEESSQKRAPCAPRYSSIYA